MARTINGKEFEDVFGRLREPFDESLFKDNLYGYPYLPVEVFRERFDQVVGVCNYDVTTSHPELVMVGTRPQIILKAAITIRDDNGVVVTTKEAPGGCAVILNSTSGEAVSLKNDEETAAGDAFKRCCKLFGMATEQLKNLRGNKKSESTVDRTEATPTEFYRITLTSNFARLGKSDGYSASVTVEGSDENMELVIWKAAQEKIAEKIPFETFLQKYIKGKTFSLYGKKADFIPKNGPAKVQLHMVEPYCGE